MADNYTDLLLRIFPFKMTAREYLFSALYYMRIRSQ